MLDVLLKSKFYSKCKTAMKLTKLRIDMIKRKRNAMEKFLKKDIVDLLKNGLDINAYGRAEGLLVELNVSACYNFVAQFCVCLLHQVSKMDKQRDCAEECKESVASLMYAAARFADLPELRELRAIFVEKYGNSLEANVSHEFIEKLKATPPTKEMKIRLLQAIATESDKNWDSKGLEQKLYNPSPSDQASCVDTNGGHPKMRKNNDEAVKKITKKDIEDNTPKSYPSPRKMKDPPSYKTRKNDDNKHRIQENEKNPVYERDSKTAVPNFNVNKHVNELNLESKGPKAELDEKKPFQRKFAPAPYNNIRYNTTHTEEFEKAPNNDDGVKSLIKDQDQKKSAKNGHEGKTDDIRFYQRKFPPVSYQDNSEKISMKDYRKASSDQNHDQKKSNPKRSEHKEKLDEKKIFESKFAPPASYTSLKAETSLTEEKIHQQDDLVDNAKPKPRSVRSVRSRRSIIPPDDVNLTKNDDVLDAIRQELAIKPGYKRMNNRKEVDEKDINEILMHYCKKESPRRGR